MNSKEQIILETWKECLGRSAIGLDENYFELGGDSVKALELIERIRDRGLTFPFAKIFSCQTIRELAAIAESVHDEKADDMQKLKSLLTFFDQGEFPSAFSSAYREYVSRSRVDNIALRPEYDHILITGGTGFLACHIAEQILTNSQSKVTLLVRAATAEQARRRVEDCFSWYFPHKHYLSRYGSRIQVVKGDITLDKLGLGAKEYEALARELDCVIHAAATIKHYGEWDDFYRINVKGTDNIIALALAGRRKSLHYISTIAAGFTVERSRERKPFTEYDLSAGQSSPNFYIQSKIGAEEKVCVARGGGLDVKIYRMGFLVQGYHSGIFQYGINRQNVYQASVELQLIATLLEMGRVPALNSGLLDFSYVDMAAQAVYLLLQVQDDSFIYHIFNPYKLSLAEFAGLANRVKPQILESLSPEAYQTYVDAHYDELKDELKDELQRILLLTLADDDIDQGLYLCSKCDRTLNLLAGRGFRWPETEPRNIGHLIRFFHP